MKADERFLRQSKAFWANVRTISEAVGYTQRGTKQVKIPNLQQIRVAYKNLGLTTAHIADDNDNLTAFGSAILAYLEHRATMLNEYVEPRLMNLQKADNLFNEMKDKLQPNCPIPVNRQSKEKKTIAYLTAMVNMIVEYYGEGLDCDFDPQKLTTITLNGAPLRTLARRLDGAFPNAVNPVAVWEIKEYYHTTTFGSRVADGVYETLLDGMELEELREHEGIHIKHYLMVDAYYTWWECGRSYLCRIVDMLHMGYVDEVLYGSEVVERLPDIVKEWVVAAKNRTIM